MDRSLSQGGDTLGQRQKHSINAFIARNEWIQEKIQLLEHSILPDIIHLDGTESQSLDELWKQHDQIEKEVDALDSGELRSLRLLAKAATQKQLSSEDTDLLEVTFRTLESLDKLLRLLRTRSKALQLLRARLRWNRQRKEVENEYQAIVTVGLSRFLKRARWTAPDEPEHSARLSGASENGLPQSVFGMADGPSTAGKRKGTAMTRQMKGETLSLDLASMNSRLHTLQYSTLSESGRILDAMIDAATIPETFIDIQETLENQVKEGLKGLSDFCGSLAKQWREADEIWWTCSAEIASLEALKRDAEEANLKLPSEELSRTFEDRLSKSQDSLLELSQSALRLLTAPVHTIRAPDQVQNNAVLKQCLAVRHQECMTRKEEVYKAVQTYSRAVEALVAGDHYKKHVLQHLSDMRNLRSTLTTTTIDSSIFEASESTLSESASSELRDGELLVSSAMEKLLPQASGIVAQLQKVGIDPNIRQSVQECLLALASETAQLKKLLQGEKKRRDYVASSSRLYHALARQQKEAEEALAELETAIPDAMWQVTPRQSGSSIADKVYDALNERLKRQSHIQDDLATLVFQDSNDKDLTGCAEAQEILSRQLDQAVNCDRRVGEKCELVRLLELQSAAVNKHAEWGEKLTQDFHSLLTKSSEPYTEELASHLAEQYNQLNSQLDSYRTAISQDIPFVSTSDASASHKLRQTDERIRNYLNSLCIKLSSASHECDSSLKLLWATEAAQRELSRVHQVYTGLSEVNSSGDLDQSLFARSQMNQESVEDLQELRKLLLQSRDMLQSLDSENMQDLLTKRKAQVVQALEALAQDLQTRATEFQAESAALSSECQVVSQESDSSSIEALSNSASGGGSGSEEQECRCDTPPSDAAFETSKDRKEGALTEIEHSELLNRLDPHVQNDPHQGSASRLLADSSMTAEKPESECESQALEASKPVFAGEQIFEGIAKSAAIDNEKASASDSQEPDEDVFGPEVYTSDRSRTTTSSSGGKVSADTLSTGTRHTSVDGKSAIEDLHQAIATIAFPPSLSSLTRSTSLRLPSITEAEALQRQVSLVHAHFDDMQNTYDLDDDTLEETRTSLRACTEALMQTMDLATFASVVNQCDEAFSDLIDTIDQADSRNTKQALRLAEESLRQVQESSLPISTDNRVVINMDRLNRTWRDLKAHAEGDADQASVSASVMSRSSSIASSLSGIPKAKRATSAHHSKAVCEHAAAVTPRVRSTGSLSRIPVASPRQWTVSTACEHPPAPSRVASPGVFLAPQSRKRAGFNHTSPTASSLLRSASSMSTVGSPALQRSFSSASATSPGGSRRSSTRRVSSSFQAEHNVRPNAYRANPKRKLDVAVGRIVNKMNVPVNITPAETFKDESGKYWIGSPEPKLYFARILRSRTVMLRVGGGWQELGSFLSTHFDHLFASDITDKLTPRRPNTQTTSPSSNPIWICSASLKASLTPSLSPENGPPVPTSRSLSQNHHYGLSRSSDSRMPDDLTSLLVKSTSRSPPNSQANQPRSKSLSIPWRV